MSEQHPDAPKTTLGNPRRQLGGPINATAVVLHRTVGSWPGDLSVGTNGGRPGYVSFHFLVGQSPGEWTQFVGPNGEGVGHAMNHAAGANGWAWGIEISGDQGERLTDWQVERVAAILQWARDVHGIQPVKYDGAQGRVGGWEGVLDHRHVAAPAGMAHADGLDDEDWSRVAAAVGGATIAPAPGPAPLPGGSLLREGSRGPEVADLQSQLIARGYSVGASGADGIFGPATRAGVIAFQRDHDLDPDGIVGPLTRGALGGQLSAAGDPGTPLIREGSRGPAVAKAQAFLAAHGFDPGPIDGAFGPLTRAATVAFQASRNGQLEVDGIIGPKTWAALA